MTIEGIREFEALRDHIYGRMRGVRSGTPLAGHRAPSAPAGEQGALAAGLRDVATELRAIRAEIEQWGDGRG